MSSRIIISILLGLVGALGTGFAALNPAQKNATFQPGAKSVVTAPTVIQPASATKWSRAKRWKAAEVREVEVTTRSAKTVEINGFVFHQAKQAPSALASTAAQPAGGKH